MDLGEELAPTYWVGIEKGKDMGTRKGRRVWRGTGRDFTPDL